VNTVNNLVVLYETGNFRLAERLLPSEEGSCFVNIRFEVFMAMCVKIEILRVVIMYSLVGRYQ
jgi:hypothetical protein